MDSPPVRRHFLPAYVFLAYLVSYIGSWTSIELLVRRTAVRGFYNWYLLLGASFSLGGIAIWGMYFIGNGATVIGAGAAELQFSYTSGYTTLAFFIPILVLLIAFLVVGSSNGKLDFARIILGGTLTGFGVCGMHYVGQAGILDYSCTYTVPHVVVGVLIGVFASIIALGTFSFYRSAWDIRWWSRVLCAVILATAISATHWVASVGTIYEAKEANPRQDDSVSRNTTCIGVIVLSVSGCVILLLITVLGQRRIASSKNQTQHIGLAAVIFNEEGDIMVTSDGSLPHRRITEGYIEKTMDDVFCVSHPLFIWIFRTSFYWSSVKPLIAPMRAHLYRIGIRHHNGTPKSKLNLANDEGAQMGDYSIVFRELFCTAAAELADDFHSSLDEMGILYDDMLNTGNAKRQSSAEIMALHDVERQGLVQENAGSGQLLFIAKIVELKEEYHLQAAGFRFAHVEKVIDKLAYSVQSKENILKQWLHNIRSYACTHHTLDRGVHLACFTVRASIKIGRGGFEILARKDATNLLPTMQLPIDRLEPWQLQYLKRLDGQSVAAILKVLRRASLATNKSQDERVFVKQLSTRLEALREEIEDPFFMDACLIGKPVEVPCRGRDADSPPGTAILIAFQIIVPLQARSPGKKLDFVPVNFFKMQQFVAPNSPDHHEYAQRTYREFAEVLRLDDFNITPGKEKTPTIWSNRVAALPKTPTDVADRRTFVDDLFELCIASRK